MKNKILFATTNQGKVRELQHYLEPFNFEVVPQALLGIDEAEETQLTFVENALLKARHACEQSGKPCIADDSGLVVHALDGAPGIHSARYAGKNAKSGDNIKKLLDEMRDFSHDQRHAHFHCSLVYLQHAEDPAPIICEGIWHGTILDAPIGDQGFGYDPIFFDLTQQCSAAELPLEKKNMLSHRGQALRTLVDKLRSMLFLE